MLPRHCTEARDLILLEYNIEKPIIVPHQPAPPLTKEIYDTFMNSLREESNHFIPPPIQPYGICLDLYTYIWDDLITTYKEYYRKHKTLPVLYNPENKSFSVVIPSPGRPNVTNPKCVKVDLRLDEQTIDRLDDYCRTESIKRSGAIRLAIDLFLHAK